jgi:hypothetical protein
MAPICMSISTYVYIWIHVYTRGGVFIKRQYKGWRLYSYQFLRMAPIFISISMDGAYIYINFYIYEYM